MPGVEAWGVSGLSFRLTAYYAAKTRFGQKCHRRLIDGSASMTIPYQLGRPEGSPKRPAELVGCRESVGAGDQRPLKDSRLHRGERPLAAQRLVPRLVNAAESLAAMPERGRQVSQGVRELAVIYPCLIRYTVVNGAFSDRAGSTRRTAADKVRSRVDAKL
jgi:plasmid stabilization system protein ParE